MRKTPLALAATAAAMIAVTQVHGQTPPPPPSLPGAATSVPTATATPAPTATPVPLTVSLSLSQKHVKPGRVQRISVHTLPDVQIFIHVHYPTGRKDALIGASNKYGNFKDTFVQASGLVTRHSHKVSVGVLAKFGGQIKTVYKSYFIS